MTPTPAPPNTFRVVDSQGTEVLYLDGNGILRATGQLQADVPTVLTAPEVARLTGLDVSTVCRQAKAGKLPVIRKLDGKRGPWLFPSYVVQTIRNRTA